MKPETQKFLDKARIDLADAKKIAAIELTNIAARAAYYAAFHAAEGFIFENTGNVAKTHSGVRSEFARLARHEPRIEKALPAFLGEGYKFKEISDYSVDPSQSATVVEATGASASAERFVAVITELLKGSKIGQAEMDLIRDRLKTYEGGATMSDDDCELTQGSGTVFRDLGLPNPEVEQLKAMRDHLFWQSELPSRGNVNVVMKRPLYRDRR